MTLVTFLLLGKISWKEFHIQFLIAKGHDEKKAEKHAEDYETIPLEAEGRQYMVHTCSL